MKANKYLQYMYAWMWTNTFKYKMYNKIELFIYIIYFSNINIYVKSIKPSFFENLYMHMYI